MSEDNLEEEKRKKEEFEKKEKEYKKRILELEQQLQIERSKSEGIQNSEREIINLRTEKLKLDKDINTLSYSNANQRDKLESLSRQVDEKLKNLNLKNISSKIKKQRLEQSTLKIKNENKRNKNDKTLSSNENLIPEKETISFTSGNNELVNSKDKQIDNINQLIEILQKDNEKLKKKCQTLGDNNLRLKLINKNKEYSKQIEKKNLEIKKMKNLLKDHPKCAKIKDDYNKNIVSVKEDIQHLKEKNDELLKKYKESNKKIKKQIEYNEILKNKKSSSKKNIKVENQEDQHINFTQAPEIFSEKELDAILIAFNNDKNKCEYYLKKLSINENYIQSLEAKHKFDVKQHLEKLNELDEQIEFLTSKFGEDTAKNRVIKSQINEYQTGKNSYNQKNNDLKKKIIEMTKLIESKEKNIKSLTLQLNNLRKNNPSLKNIDINKLQIYQSNNITINSNDNTNTNNTNITNNNNNENNNLEVEKNSSNKFNSGKETENEEKTDVFSDVKMKNENNEKEVEDNIEDEKNLNLNKDNN